MKVSSNDVLRAAIRYYKVQPHSPLGEYVHKHESGTTEGVSLILLLTELEKSLLALEEAEAKLRDIGRLLYSPPFTGPPG